MTDTTNRTRVQKGVSTGGQFAIETRGEAALTLVSPHALPRFSPEPMLTEGGRSPWGPIQSVHRVAAGIEFASTEGHGGYKLSAERNRIVPAALRRSGGWYEEDCEQYIVAYVFSDEMDRDHAEAEQGVKDWFPDQYTQATGQALTEADSRQLRHRAEEATRAATEQAHKDAHHDRDLRTGHYDDSYTPDGLTIYQTERPADGSTRYYLAPSKHDSEIPLDGHPGAHDVTTVHLQYREEERTDPLLHSNIPLTEPVTDLGVDTASLTPAARKIAEKELGTLYRFPKDDGTTYVATMEKNLETESVHGKTVYWDSEAGHAAYYVQLGDSYVRRVKKATWDALAGVPDTTTESGYAELETSRAYAAHDKAQEKVTAAMRGHLDWRIDISELRRKAEAAAAKLEKAKGERDALTALGTKVRNERKKRYAQRLTEITQP